MAALIGSMAALTGRSSGKTGTAILRNKNPDRYAAGAIYSHSNFIIPSQHLIWIYCPLFITQAGTIETAI